MYKRQLPKPGDELFPENPSVGTHVTSVNSLSVTDSDTVFISVSGTTNSLGWTNFRLVQKVNFVEPADGIVTFDFYATEPRIHAWAISPGNLAVTTLKREPWMKGIRVVAGSNELVAKFGESVGNGGPVTF